MFQQAAGVGRRIPGQCLSALMLTSRLAGFIALIIIIVVISKCYCPIVNSIMRKIKSEWNVVHVNEKGQAVAKQAFHRH